MRQGDKEAMKEGTRKQGEKGTCWQRDKEAIEQGGKGQGDKKTRRQ